MMRRTSRLVVFSLPLLFWNNLALAYEDDDLLCRPGWSLELYHQQISQQNNQQQFSMMDYQYAIANAAAQQRAREVARAARLARQEKAARQREERIAKLKLENAAKAASVSSPSPAVKTATKPAR